jgi:hypothetical protein
MNTLPEVADAVIEQVETEREALTEIWEDNQRLEKWVKAQAKLLDLAERIILNMEKSGLLFIDEQTRKWITKFQEDMVKHEHKTICIG